ncbi:MAG: hypothetical protein ACTTKH_07480 [Treponema sp.]
MKRLFSLFFLFLFPISMSLFSQVAVDIFDPFYEDLSIWQDMGLINDAPSLKPYPLQEIKRILEIVKEKGDAEQTRIATEYHNRFFSKAYHLGGGIDIAFQFPNKAKELTISPILEVNYNIFRLLSISANISGVLTNKLNHNSIKPAFHSSKYDLASDDVKAGSFYVLPNFNSGFALGTSEYYFSAAIARTHYGSFFDDSIFISKNALHQGQFNFVINKPKWSYNHTFLTLTSTDDFKNYKNPKKFLSFHSIDIRPLPWLSFGVVDSIIYGDRFEPIYFLPFSVFFISQGLYDFPDNSLIGLTSTIKPYKGISLDIALYADDLGFNEIIKFKKDARWRMAGQFGFSYTMPISHWFTFAKLDYTFIAPYTYAHVSSYRSDASNYSAYTHEGEPLATNLAPNSDRLSLKLKFRPKHGINLDFFNNFIRHGNIVESIDDIEFIKEYLSKLYNTSGTHLTHATITKEDGKGGTTNKGHAFLYATPFMKQQTIQYIDYLGFLLSFNLPILKSGGKILFSIGYTFEANINEGVLRPIYTPREDWKGWNNKTLEEIAKERGAGVTANDIANEIMEERNKQLSEWRSKAISQAFNHYIRLSFKVTY